MFYACSTARTEIDTHFRVLGYHNVPHSSCRRRIVCFSQSISAGNGLTCMFIATTSHGIPDFIFEKIFLAGLVLQLVSFTLFTGIYLRFLYRVYTLERDTWECDKMGPWYRDWRALAAALALSCVGILVSACFISIQ